MKKQKFKYDSRLTDSELDVFRSFLGKQIYQFRLENASISLAPNFQVENIGSCFIHFNPEKTGVYEVLEMISLFHETPPIVDNGGFALKKTVESHIPLKTKMSIGRKEAIRPATSISGYDRSKIVSFQFFGYHERRSLQEVDPDMDLAKFGYTDFPELEVDTIEFLVIEHESSKRTIICSSDGGFWYNFLTDEPLDEPLIFKSYLKVNGFEKNIVLHHDVSF